MSAGVAGSPVGNTESRHSAKQVPVTKFFFLLQDFRAAGD